MQAAWTDSPRAPARSVRIVIFDVDGVLTDGSVSLDARGVESKRFHVVDGTAIHLLGHHGIEAGLLSGRRSGVVEHRARELGLSFYQDGIIDKKPKILELLDARGLRPEQLCYVGDDIIDIPCMLLSGFPVAVANARPEVKRIAAYITRSPASEAAVREVAEILLKARDCWRDVMERFHRCDP